MAFRFSRREAFCFRAGQALDLILPGADGPADTSLRHAFSIVSAPHEPDVLLATRMRDSRFKQVLASSQPGASVKLDGPFGSLALAADSPRPAVLIAGGIGITPFVSMLRHRAHLGSSRPVSLLYANRQPEDAAILDELRKRASKAPTFEFVPTMTDAGDRKDWSRLTRRIDADFIRSAVPDVLAPLYTLWDRRRWLKAYGRRWCSLACVRTMSAQSRSTGTDQQVLSCMRFGGRATRPPRPSDPGRPVERRPHAVDAGREWLEWVGSPPLATR